MCPVPPSAPGLPPPTKSQDWRADPKGASPGADDAGGALPGWSRPGPLPPLTRPSIVLLPGTAMSGEWHTVVLDLTGRPGLSGEWRPCHGRTTWYGRRPTGPRSLPCRVPP